MADDGTGWDADDVVEADGETGDDVGGSDDDWEVIGSGQISLIDVDDHDDDDFFNDDVPLDGTCIVRESFVYQVCTSSRVPFPSVEFLDISEDIQGRDVVTYRCPACGQKHTSFVIG